MPVFVLRIKVHENMTGIYQSSDLISVLKYWLGSPHDWNRPAAISRDGIDIAHTHEKDNKRWVPSFLPEGNEQNQITLFLAYQRATTEYLEDRNKASKRKDQALSEALETMTAFRNYFADQQKKFNDLDSLISPYREV
jgi:hypothetical protein